MTRVHPDQEDISAQTVQKAEASSSRFPKQTIATLTIGIRVASTTIPRTRDGGRLRQGDLTVPTVFLLGKTRRRR